MKKYLLTLVAVICFAISANAASLCGGGLKFTFTGNSLSGSVVFTSPGGTLKGTYTVNRKNDIRITWDTGYTNELIYVKDGVFSFGDVTLRECQ